MDNETLQSIRLILKEELDPIKNEIQGLKEGQERLEARFDGLETRFDGLETRFDVLETRFDSLETKVDRLEVGQEKITTMVEELDPKNATRHSDIIKSIKILRDDLINVEIITSSNWNEIAKLKKIK